MSRKIFANYSRVEHNRLLSLIIWCVNKVYSRLRDLKFVNVSASANRRHGGRACKRSKKCPHPSSLPKGEETQEAAPNGSLSLWERDGVRVVETRGSLNRATIRPLFGVLPDDASFDNTSCKAIMRTLPLKLVKT